MFLKLRKKLKNSHKHPTSQLALFPLDSTIVTLTSKLLWSQGIHQVKLFAGLNLLTAEPGGIFIHFGQGHDSKYGDSTIESTPSNGLSIMDRGFSSLSRLRKLLGENPGYFLLRIKNNIHLKMLENSQFLVGTGHQQVTVRVVSFCDLESPTEFRFITNLPETGEPGISNEEVGEFYRLRWQIE